MIVHRGTKFTNVRALRSDIKGVLHNQYVQQMESASKFEHKVVEVLREFNKDKRTNFLIFFTGHSSGLVSANHYYHYEVY